MYQDGYPPTNGQNSYTSPYDPYAQYQQPQYPPQYQQYPPQYPQYPQYPQGDNGWTPTPPTQGVPQQAAAPAKKGKKTQKTGGSGSGNGGGKKRKSIKWQLIKLLLILILIAGATVAVYLWKIQSDVKPYVSVFLDNISVDGINLSGMTWEEGSNAVWAQANEKQSSWYVRLKNTAGETMDITADTLGISFDPSAALEQAWAIGHETSSQSRKTIFDLKNEIDAMKSSNAEFYSAEQSANISPIDSILQSMEQAAYVAPQNAEITGFYPDDALNPFSFQYEKAGYHLDTTAIREQILEMVQTYQSGEILIKPELLMPEVTVADLEKTVALRFRAVTPIDKHSTEERTNNIRVAFSKINGTVLKDGDKFSFNKVVGRRTVKNGFYEALEIAYGEYVTGIGGGVCQASTTVFLAAVQAGMTITDLTAHSSSVSYTEMGKDATVSDTKGREIDFQFKNNSGAPVYILASVITDTANKNRLLCEVKIYGHSLENVRYELEADTVEYLDPPEEIEYIKDTKATYVTYTNEEYEYSKAKEGYVVETYLCTLVDNVQTERTLLSKTTYPNRKAKIYVGVTDPFEYVPYTDYGY